METLTYDLKTLCALAGPDVTPRTVHYYIQQGLLPHATSAGPRARYDDRHLGRLRLIKRLQRDHLPLAEIRERLHRLTDGDIDQALGEASPAIECALAADRSPRPHMSCEIVEQSVGWSRSQWDRVALNQDLELHVRRPLTREGNRKLERLLAAARDILKED